MNEKLQSALKWGAIGGLSMIILGLIFYILNIEYGSTLNYLGYAILVGVILMGSYEFRDKLNGGYATFKELFKYAIIICLIYALISTFWSIVFMQFVAPDLITEVLTQTRMQLEEKGIDEAAIEVSLNMTRKMMQPHFFAMTSMFALMVVGALISVLISSVLRRFKPEDELIIDELETTK